MNLLLALWNVAVDVFSTCRRNVKPPSSRYSTLPQNKIIKCLGIVLTEFRGGGVVGGDSITAVILSLVLYTIQANIELSSPLVHAQN